MALTSGSRIGSYEISAQIGVGGMGEVYRARDTKLGRDVAIKVLPEAFAQDAERLARFDREAKTLATLNHPGIAQIYGIEDAPAGPGQAPVKALVMELVEGLTLADRIAEGPIPFDEALPVAKQIAEALEAAHEQGIVHRDLKPANVKLRPDGAVKVLDFGLAKAMEPAGMASSLSMSPTITTPAMTQAGLILGTAAYMAPEQARGKPLDRRADIWSFGAVLFEMLTGRRAFEGEDVTDTLAAVVRSEPDWGALPADLPARVVRALRVCLQKNPRERGGDIGAIRLALEGAFETTVTLEPTAAEPSSPSWWSQPRRVGALVALGVLAGVAAGWGLFVSGRAETNLPARRFSIVLPEAQVLASGNGTRVAVSPDGQTLAYRAVDSTGVEHIYQRRLDQLTATVVPGTDGANSDQFFSPDGEKLAFSSPGGLMRVDLAGGTPIRIAPLPGGFRGGTWGDGFVIVATRDFLGRVADTGGEIEPLTTPGAGRDHWYPQLLPGGRAVLFTDAAGSLEGDLYVLDLNSRETRMVVGDAMAGHYTPSGHIVFLRDGDLWAVTFDLDTLTAGERPALVEQGIRVEGGGAVQFAVADDGSLVYVQGTAAGSAALGLVWVDREGQQEALPVPARNYSRPRVSPDGTRVAVEIPDDSAGSIWVANARGNLSLVSSEAAEEQLPIWTPDGEHLVYAAARDGVWGFYRKSADGAGEEELLGTVENAGVLLAGNWTPDGEHLVFAMGVPGGSFDIGVFSMEDGTWEPLLDSDDVEFGPVLSPDGEWIAYSSTETGTMEVYVRRFPDLSGKQQVSSGGAIDPAWSNDGRVLFFIRVAAGPTELASVSIDPGSPLVIGPAEVAFPYRYVRVRNPARYYDIGPDGRFLFVSRPEGERGDSAAPQAAAITWVQNWFTDLTRLAPTD